jgi:recombination protein RecA
VRVRVTKNKVAPPFREAEFDIMYNEGISKTGDLLDIGTDLEIVTKRGAFFTYGDTKLGQGREKAKEFLKANPAVAAQIEKDIRARAGQASQLTRLGGSGSAAADGAEEDGDDE